MVDTQPHGRRQFLKATGAAAVASAIPFSGTASAGDGIIDSAFDLATSALQQSLVVFDTNDDVDQLGALDLVNGYHKFEVLPIGYTELSVNQLKTLADWDSVQYIQKNVELDYYNEDTREVTNVSEVQSSGYTGDSVHTAVIDSGVDGNHPDLDSSLVANWRWAGNPLGEPTLWVPAGDLDTDDNGHGTHCSGTVAGDGTESDGQQRGMAPDADLTVYSAGLALLIVKPVAAFDHLLARQKAGETDISIVSNSYGSSNGEDFNPDDALNVATWEAWKEGLLPVFAAGNSGPDTNTLNQYAKAPNVLGVAATRDDKTVTDFSSRGRKASTSPSNWERKTALDNLEQYRNGGSASGPLGIYRPGIGAPGNAIVSTMAPTHPLNLQGADTDLWYATISGTSMACPAVAGIATLVVDAYRQNNGGSPTPAELLNTITAEAEDAVSDYKPWNAGSGFVNAQSAVTRAENGNMATYSDVTLVDY
ncbi:S8 family serine peptidase [Haladaptatus pallidirubidus]|uniref:Peptidase S8/S53 domain-containing protein n=2 Tax=Haladaptatus pallidirubidus TaxID=1008152 RepID=A0AAV3UMC5_9EURY|nr:S8 family serine peptidase [Haladaptatus pallidirubidus]